MVIDEVVLTVTAHGGMLTLLSCDYCVVLTVNALGQAFTWISPFTKPPLQVSLWTVLGVVKLPL